MVATMPYIALQLVGMEVVIKALGLTGELPLVAAFVILALYTYSSGLRAPALIAFVKDIMIYIVVLVAVVMVPMKLGGYAAVFAAANDAFAAKGGATGLILKPEQMLPIATLALGSALAAFMYPHTLTGIFASKSRRHHPQECDLAAGLHGAARPDRAARLHGLCRRRSRSTRNNDVVPVLFKALFPSWFAGFAFAAIAIGALVPAAVMSIGAANLFTRNFWKSYVNPDITPAGEADGGQDRVAGGQGRRAGLHPVPADAISRSTCSCSAACGSCRPFRRWCSDCSPAGSAPKACCSAGPSESAGGHGRRGATG